MNAVRFCTKEEEVLKMESFRRRWNAVRLCTKDEISKIELQNTGVIFSLNTVEEQEDLLELHASASDSL
ncbi:unnamed protein product [Sphagnum jensenii]|uniref:Uncharacterized protein n=1 Tax=Sphagnum jensenii TaxID=128206 RepID=A0ABP0WE94_9BRYO